MGNRAVIALGNKQDAKIGIYLLKIPALAHAVVG
jgi:hypothetical protein